MKNIAVFSGSFCPFTKGHEDILNKALPLFDEIIALIGNNSEKNNIFSVNQRIEWIKTIYKDNPKVRVESYNGMTVDFCKSNGVKYIIRGLRNNMDFVKEQEMAKINNKLCQGLETLFILPSQGLDIVSSTLVRELWSNCCDYSEYLSYKLPDHMQTTRIVLS